MIKAFFIESSTAQYTAEEFSWFQKNYLEAGVFGDSGGTMGMAVAQNGAGNMTVVVPTGTALLSLTKNSITWKTIVYSDSTVSVPIASNVSGSNRVDAIIVRISSTIEPNVTKTNVGTIERVAGAGVSALSDAAIQAAIGTDGFIRLADVTVANAAAAIVTANIADVRVRVQTNEAVRYAPKRIAFRVLTVDPVAPELVEGLMWYNSTGHTLNFYNGTTTVVISSGFVESFTPFKVTAQGSPNMTLAVTAGVAYINTSVVKFAGGNSPTFTAPGSNSRIDLLVIDSTGTLAVIQGLAGASPTAPTYVADKLVLAEIFLRSTSTVIKNTDDAINGYISKDTRAITTNEGFYGASGASSGTAYTITPTPGISAYSVGQYFTVKADVANTGAATLNASGAGAKSILNMGNVALKAGDIKAGQIFECVYDGTNMQLVTPPGTVGNKVATAVADITIAFSTTETDIISTTLLGNILGTANAIRIRLAISQWATENTNQASTTFRLYYGGSVILSFAKTAIPTITSSQVGFIEFMLYGNANTSVQRATAMLNAPAINGTSAAAVGYATAAAAVDSTANQALKVTIQESVAASSNNQIIISGATIEVLS